MERRTDPPLNYLETIASKIEDEKLRNEILRTVKALRSYIEIECNNK